MDWRLLMTFGVAVTTDKRVIIRWGGGNARGEDWPAS